MSPSSVYALVRLLVVRKLYWSEVIVVASVHVHDYVPRTGDQEVPVKPGFLFLSRRRTTILSHYRVLYRQVPRSIVLDTVSSFSVFCRRLYIALARGVAASGNQECILLSSLVFVQKFPVAAAHLLLASTPSYCGCPCFWQAMLFLAFSVYRRFVFRFSFRFRFPFVVVVVLSFPPHHALSYAAGWLNQDGGGEGEGHFFQMQLGTAAFGGGHGW